MTEISEMDDRTSRGHSMLLGLMCGAATGALLALLFAPKPGRELRRQVADSAVRTKRRAADAYSETTGKVRDVVDRSRQAYVAGIEAYRDANASHAAARAAKNSNISAS